MFYNYLESFYWGAVEMDIFSAKFHTYFFKLLKKDFAQLQKKTLLIFRCPFFRVLLVTLAIKKFSPFKTFSSHENFHLCVW